MSEFDEKGAREAAERKRKQKIKEEKAMQKGSRKAMFALVSLIAAIVFYVVLTVIQYNIVNKVEEKGVVVAAVDIPKGIVLNQENMMKYFKVELRPAKDVPVGYYTSGHPLVGMITDRAIKAKEIVITGSFIADDYYKDIEDPIELSLEFGKIGQAVGGSLRAGDIINIKVVVDMSMDKLLNNTPVDDSEASDEEQSSYSTPQMELSPGGETFEIGEDDVTAIEQSDLQFDDFASAPMVVKKMFSGTDSDKYAWSASGRYACVPVCENVRVVNAYTSAGVDTAASNAKGETQVTNIVTIVVPKALEEKIVLACEEGTLRVSRVIQNTEDEVVEEKPDEDNVAEEKTSVSDEKAGDK